MQELIEKWKQELDALEQQAYAINKESHKVQYSALATHALRLSMCITDVEQFLESQKNLPSGDEMLPLELREQ